MRWRPRPWPALTRAQVWPGIRTPTLMARTVGGCFLFGCLIVALLTSVAPLGFSSTAVQYDNAAVAGLIGISILLWGARLRLWQFHAIIVAAILQITVSVYEASDGIVAISFATLYTFCLLYTSPSPRDRS